MKFVSSCTPSFYMFSNTLSVGPLEKEPASPLARRVRNILSALLFLSNLALLVGAVAYTFFTVELPFVAICIGAYGLLYLGGTFFIRKGDLSYEDYSALFEKLKKTNEDLAYREESISRIKETSNRFATQERALQKMKEQETQLRRQIAMLRTLASQEEGKMADVQERFRTLEVSLHGADLRNLRALRATLGI